MKTIKDFEDDNQGINRFGLNKLIAKGHDLLRRSFLTIGLICGIFISGALLNSGQIISDWIFDRGIYYKDKMVFVLIGALFLIVTAYFASKVFLMVYGIEKPIKSIKVEEKAWIDRDFKDL